MLWIGFSQLHCLPSFELTFKSLEDLVFSRRTDCATKQWPFFKCVRSPGHLGRCTQSHDPLSPGHFEGVTKLGRVPLKGKNRPNSQVSQWIHFHGGICIHTYINRCWCWIQKTHPSYWSIHSTLWTISRGIFVDQCGRTPSTLTGSPSEATRCCVGKSTIPTSLGKTIGLA